MSAETIAQALGGTPEGNAWRCRCILCGRRTMTLSDAGNRLLVWCWAGCDSKELFRKLHRRGLAEHVQAATAEEVEQQRAAQARKRKKAIEEARWLWAEECYPADGTIAEKYLWGRGIIIPPPAALRYHPHLYHSPGVFRPALVAKVEHVEHGHVALACTFLSIDGSGKACITPNRKFLGPVGGAAVRLRDPKPAEVLCIGEGIETMLSVMQECDKPAWAALSAGGLAHLILPQEYGHVIICADNDRAGLAAAHVASRKWVSERRHIRLAVPRHAGQDFNDVLLQRRPAMGGDHAA